MLATAAFGADAVAHGLVLGLIYGALAAGLVLVYRASGVVNFAHGETGALGAAVLAKLVLDEHWPWMVALPLVIALGGGVGALTEVVVARRLARRPRLALVVATIGVAQLLLVGELLIPKINEVAPYPTPIHRQLVVGSVVLTGQDFLALAAVPAVMVALALWLGRTPSGRAIRAAADNPAAARLAGIRPQRAGLAAWTVAGMVSTATAVLANPIQGVAVGQRTEVVGAGLLARALAAALLGRFNSLPLAMAGGIGVGLLQSAADVGRIDAAVADVVILVAVLVLVVAHTSRADSVAAPGERELVSVPPVRRRVTSTWWLPIVALGAALVPVVAGRSSQLFLLSRMALFALVGLSVVVLTGWAGQLSLGQFAMVGIGTFGAGALEAHGLPFLATVPLAVVFGGAASLLVGVPALRARGLDLAITTLALAVACSSWLFTRSWFVERGGVAVVTRSRLLRGDTVYYEVCLLALGAGLVVVAAVRRGDLGRRLLAVRANERRAATLGVSPAATKLIAFALAGGLAGGAGALLGGLRIRSTAGDFGPAESLRVVALAVIGGAGSWAGAVVGAVVVLGIPALFGDTTVAGLLPTGIGLLVLVLVFPGGVVELSGRVGKRLRRREAPPDRPSLTARVSPPAFPRPAHLEATGITVHFGGRVALDGVDLSAAPGEVVGLIGANGAGKSTLLDVISGFTPGGSVQLGEVRLDGLAPARRARTGVGRVLQDARLFQDLTIEEAVLLAARGHPHHAAAAIDLLELQLWAGVACQELPTGTRRLVELACALAGRPSLLLLDEPAAGLGLREAEALASLLRRLRDQLGTTMVLVEHDVALVVAVADRVVCLETGRVLAMGLPAEVVRDPAVVASFLGPTGVNAPSRGPHPPGSPPR